jgi:hypothetical protein
MSEEAPDVLARLKGPRGSACNQPQGQ